MGVNSAAPQGESPQQNAGTESQAPSAVLSTPAESPTSSQQPEQAPSVDWFREAFNRHRTTTGAVAEPIEQQPATPTPPASAQPTESESAQENRQEQPTHQRQDTPAARPYTQDEFNRHVQAETDRRLAKFQREEGERRRQAAAAEQARQERELRQKDPYAYARLVEQREAENAQLQQQLQQTHGLLTSSVREYDTAVLDPIMTALPEKERKQILEGIGEGIPGRGQAATSALKVLEKHWKAQGVSEARQTLLKDQAFIKEVLARYGGQRPEPDHVPAINGAAPTRAGDMNTLMRQATGRLGP